MADIISESPKKVELHESQGVRAAGAELSKKTDNPVTHLTAAESPAIGKQFGNAGISQSIGGGATKTDFPSGNTEYSMPDGRSVSIAKNGDIDIRQGDEYVNGIRKSTLDALPKTGENKDLGGGWQGSRSADGYSLSAPKGEVLDLDKNGKLKSYTNGDEFRTTVPKGS